MTSRIRLAIELVAAAINLEFARRGEGGLSPKHVVAGWCLGAGFRHVEERYVGRFREQPLRYLVFVGVWSVTMLPLLSRQSLAAQRSTGVGINLGSVAYRGLARGGDRQ